MRCPFCEQRTGKPDHRGSLAVSARSGNYACFKCGTKGWEPKLAAKREKLRAEEVLLGVATPDDPPVLEPPEGFQAFAEDVAQEALVFRAGRAYLENRGVGSHQVRLAGLGAVPGGFWGRRVIAPVLWRGKWRGWVARDWTNKAEKRYLYPRGMRRGLLLYNREALEVETDVPCLVVEGVFDALRYLPDAVACLGKPGESHVEMLLEARRPIVVVLDGDAVDESWQLAARLRAEERATGWVRLPPESDPGDCPSGWLKMRAWECLTESL